MIATSARVLTGFILASLTAGLVQVLFIMTPAQMAQLPAQALQERAAQAGTLALLAATHAGIFAAAFTLIAAIVGEWMRVRSAAYYIATGAVIAALGFSAQFASEVAGQPTIFNNYAIAAFITSGALAGLVYWLAAGRYAGKKPTGDAGDELAWEPNTDRPVEEPRTWRNRPRIVVEDTIAPGSVAKKNATLSERIAEREEKRAADNPTLRTAPAGVEKPVSKPATIEEPTDGERKIRTTLNEINDLPLKKS